MAIKKTGLTYEEIMEELRNKIYRPVYFLQGEEPWFIDQITEYLQNTVLDEAQKAFNLFVFYGRDTDIATVINTARRYPMMSNYLLVIVKEAQALKSIDELSLYLKAPLLSTILVINYKYKSLDKRTSLYKILNEKGYVADFPKLYEDKIPKWIGQYLNSRKASIDPEAAVLLTEFVGDDLSKIVNELEKLLIILPENKRTITASLIEKYIGISKDFNAFELNKALAYKQVVKAYRIGKYLADNKLLVAAIPSMYNLFSKVLLFHSIPDKSDKNSVAAALRVNPFFVEEYRQAARNYSPSKARNIIALLREYDLKSKGMGNVSAEPADLMKELLFKILH